MNLPYSIAHFGDIRREGHFYADKTRFIPLLEDGRRGRRYVLFLRPRRFGKTTFLSMLEHYYDIARKDQFEALFTGLHVGDHPTSERNRFLVLGLDFSGLGLERGVEALRVDMLYSLRQRLRDFFIYYAALLPGQLEAWLPIAEQADSPAQILGAFLDFLRRSPHPLYILIDEYDKLINDLIARGDHDAYKQVLAASGFIRLMYERIKIGTVSVVRRVFMTGISPVMLNDMASGFGIAKNLSVAEEYHDLCGFSQAEVETLVDQTLASGSYTLPRDQLLGDLRRYFNGYRFSEREDRLYNPNAVLNFLAELRPPDRYPRTLLDQNLRTDHQKLYTLLFTRDQKPRQGPMEMVRTLLTGDAVPGTLHELFPLEKAYDEHFFPSYLYYLGLVTIVGIGRGGELQLAIPNLVIREIHGAILSYILEQAAGIDLHEDLVQPCVNRMGLEGQIDSFLALIDTHVLQKLSNRDLIRLDERGLKMLMLAYLSMSELFLPFSELEANRGYCDLILTINRRFDAGFSFLIELKYVKAEGRKEEALRTAVEACFQEGEAQLRSYLQDERLGTLRGPQGWKAFTVVQVGTRAILYRELGQPTVTLRWDPARPRRAAVKTRKKRA